MNSQVHNAIERRFIVLLFVPGEKGTGKMGSMDDWRRYGGYPERNPTGKKMVWIRAFEGIVD